MPGFNTQWKTDNYKFVGKSFEYNYANRMNLLSPIMGEVTTKSIDYEIEGAGGYGELPDYDGSNLNIVHMARGFKTIVAPSEKLGTVQIHYKNWLNDMKGECKKAGSRLAGSCDMTVYLKALRTLAGAFGTGKTGGDGKQWAATDHPIASKGSQGRTFVADPDAGTFSNLFNKSLSVASITDLMSSMTRLVTPDGLPFLCKPDTLLVSPELEPMAKKICGDNAKLFPTEVGNVNPVQNELSYIVIGGGADGFSAKQWALCDKKIMKEVFLSVFNTKPMVMQNTTDNVLIDQYTAYCDFDCGWGDARQIAFCQG